MASCENSWAGRLVISLQLLSWCAVGALLLHRGISSVKPEFDRPLSATTPTYEDATTNASTNYSQFEEPTSTLSHESKIAKKSSIIDKHLPSKLTTLANKLDRQTNNSNKLLDPTEGDSFFTVNTSETSLSSSTESFQTSRPSPKMTATVTHNVRVPPALRKNLVLTPSGVVMAALGAIMLILGPSIVILRCCDAGRQGRFSKLSADDYALAMSALDRPPAYEEVADNAPRYSALFPDEDEIVEVNSVT